MPHLVQGTLTAKSECMQAFCAAVVAQVASHAHAEAGCDVFESARNADDSPELMLFKSWSEKTAFDVQSAPPYTHELYGKPGDPKFVELTALEG